jgi:hypothetical protein
MQRCVLFAAMGVASLFVSVGLAQENKPSQRSDSELQAIAKLKEQGVHVLELAQNDPRLEVAFHLQADSFKDDSLALVSALKDVYSLNLRGTKVSDDALAQIKDCTSLVRLHLERTPVTDAGLAHLKSLANLYYLNLYGTAVTDAGLEHLKGLKNLRRLYLWQTKVTDAGVEALKKEIPELQVVRGVEEAKPAEAPKEAPKEEKKDEKRK